MRVIIIGGSGLVGSRIVELLGNKYSFQNLSHETGTDITRVSTLKEIRDDAKSQLVLHLAAKTDVDGCERDKPLGERGDAWKINVLGTENVVKACQKRKKKIIYISTDFVFDGVSAPARGYQENDAPNPINWYGETKFRGEEIVKNSGLSFLIVRIAYPYRAIFPAKKDFVRAILERLQARGKIEAVDDHIITPTFIDDIAHALDVLIANNATGIFHVVGGEFLSPYGAAHKIAEEFGLNPPVIQKTTRADFFKNRAPRPFNLSLGNDKIEKLGVRMRTFGEGLREIKKQMNLYL